MKVTVEPHNPSWSLRFEAESGIVARALGPNVVAIHHIGSTAIPGIHAKPVIDLLVSVTDIYEIDARNAAMMALGYEAMGEFGISGRRYFRKDEVHGTRTHQVHAFASDSSEVKRHLAFRDFMRVHPDWAERYSNLKRELARAHPDDIERYMEGKDAFIKAADCAAAQWWGLSMR